MDRTASLPPTSDDEPSEYYTLKTGKKRERATQACSPCRKKKKRCDGAKPNCRNCMDTGLDCSYAVCKRRGPRKGYVQLLEERLALLERRLSSMPQGNTGEVGVDASSVSQTELTGGSIDDVTMPSEEVVLHLVDYFFKYINSIFPLVHHSTLVQSIKDGTISKPLLWSVMAIGARFSDHPDIKTDPPYWAGEKFAKKAGSLINNDLFEPTVPNLQYWGVMACLEYGRAAGSRAWIYGGLAARLCFELGFHKEETLQSPIYRKDGTMDRVAMLMRRRIFWSCFNIDKYGSAGNSRPQFFSKGDYNVGLPDEESLALLNPLHQNVTVDYQPVTVDSLGSFVKHYLSLMELFGDVIKGLQRAKTNQGKSIWPPMEEFDQLNNDLQAWKSSLPPHMDFSLEDLQYHLKRASRGKINHYLCAHVIWRTLMLALHRGSLAYVDQQDTYSSSFSQHTWERIQYSVNVCKQVVHDVMPIFRSMKDICGINVIPYMGYSSYMFATILMTSAFTKTEEEHRKGTKGLLLLYDMIELLRPYWPVCERLSVTTRDLIVSHSRMYEYSQEEHYKRTGYEPAMPQPRQYYRQPQPQPQQQQQQQQKQEQQRAIPSLQHESYAPAYASRNLHSLPSLGQPHSMASSPLSLAPAAGTSSTSSIPSPSSLSSSLSSSAIPVATSAATSTATTTTSASNIPVSMTGLLHTNEPSDNLRYVLPPQQQQQQPILTNSLPSINANNPLLSNTMEMGNSFGLADAYTSSTGIDFNSSAFLYDTGLFGQIMFDETKYLNNGSSMNNIITSNNNNNNNDNGNNNNNTTNISMYNLQQQPPIYNSTSSDTHNSNDNGSINTNSNNSNNNKNNSNDNNTINTNLQGNNISTLASPTGFVPTR